MSIPGRGAIVIGVLEIILYGGAESFFNAQQVQTSSCELDGESAHPEARRGADPAVIHEAIVACMKEAGYEWGCEHRRRRDAPIATNLSAIYPFVHWTGRS
jgi:hypothetical protein